MATAASTTYAIDGTLGVRPHTADLSAGVAQFKPGHVMQLGNNRVAIYARIDYDATYVGATASASVTITNSTDGTTIVTGSGIGHVLLAQDGTAKSGSFAWVIKDGYNTDFTPA